MQTENEMFDLRAEFDKHLERIESEHISFFKDRKPAHNEQKHDKLENHILLVWDNLGNAKIAQRGEELPNGVYEKVVEAFHKVFSK